MNGARRAHADHARYARFGEGGWHNWSVSSFRVVRRRGRRAMPFPDIPLAR